MAGDGELLKCLEADLGEDCADPPGIDLHRPDSGGQHDVLLEGSE